MKVKLFKDAASKYVQRCYKGARPDCGMLHKPEWEKMLSKVQGKWLTVETDFLFADQFNTIPIKGVSDLGIRVTFDDVEAVKDDIRIGRYFDRWTNKNYKRIPKICLTPERKQYLFRFQTSTNPYRRGVWLDEVPVF